MIDDPSRRRVLAATAAAGLAGGAAGCLDSVPLVGGDGPCSDLESFVDAAMAGDAEQAVEYLPYEYDPELERADALADLEVTDEQREQLSTFDVEVSCECAEALSDDEIASLDASLGDHEITAAQELGFLTSISGEFMGEEFDEEREETGVMVEIDGDGWYVWETQQSFDKC